MVTTTSMATRSSLELMLDKLQQLEEQPAIVPPALPVRPVSKARLPRPRRPLQLDFAGKNLKVKGEGYEKEDLSESNGIVNHCLKKIQECEGICKIQKLYRGHQVRCCYNKLRKGSVALQSFIRGELARTGYQHTRKYIQHQSGIRCQMDQTRVSYHTLADLQKRVMKTEAKLRGKREENMALKRKLSEFEKKWQQYEEKMKSMEREWQDQLTYTQECLASDKKNSSDERINLDIPMNSNNEMDHRVDEGECKVEERRVREKVRPREELRKLKLRFKAWKKEYKNKLRDAQSSFRKRGINPAHKSLWGRLSH